MSQFIQRDRCSVIFVQILFDLSQNGIAVIDRSRLCRFHADGVIQTLDKQ